MMLSGWTPALLVLGLLLCGGALMAFLRRRRRLEERPLDVQESSWEEREIEAMLADGTTPGGSPRAQHYDFAHLLLRRRFFEDPLGLSRLLAGEDGVTFLEALWNEAQGSDYAEPIPPAGLRSEHATWTGGGLVVVTLPAAQAMTEAHLVALAVPEVGDPRYFTLELGFGEDDEPRTVLCEWRGESHANFGDGPAVDGEAFAAAVRAHLEPDAGN